MVFPAGHLLVGQPGLKKAAGRGPGQVLPDQRVRPGTWKRLSGQQDMTACPLLDLLQDLQIADQRRLIYDIDRGAQPRLDAVQCFHHGSLDGSGVLVHHPGQAVLVQHLHEGIGVHLLQVVDAGLAPLAVGHQSGADHGGHAGGVADGLAAQLLIARLVVADVVDVDGPLLAVLDAGVDAAMLVLPTVRGPGMRDRAAAP